MCSRNLAPRACASGQSKPKTWLILPLLNKDNAHQLHQSSNTSMLTKMVSWTGQRHRLLVLNSLNTLATNQPKLLRHGTIKSSLTMQERIKKLVLKNYNKYSKISLQVEENGV